MRYCNVVRRTWAGIRSGTSGAAVARIAVDAAAPIRPVASERLAVTVKGSRPTRSVERVVDERVTARRTAPVDAEYERPCRRKTICPAVVGTESLRGGNRLAA